uniref:2Fe-2S-binding protein n=1 Tax=Nocardiopsis sp. CMB-M0232 TaxID=1231934 RepID=A0A0D5BV00_9ACTN|nr:2Fe-2S-binding protein [Nocardiopsis sp. CMB-M0232]
MKIGDAIRRIERSARLDPITGFARSLVRRVPRGRAADTLHGVELGHPMHPLLVQVPIGAWMSATVLDLFPGTRRPALGLIDLGVAAALPAMAAGALDWAEQHPRQQRVGIVHAVSAKCGVLLYTASAVARHRGHQGWGKALGFAGLGMVGVAGMLGAHIAYSLNGGVSHTEQDRDLLPDGWHDLGPMDDFAEDTPVRRMVGGVPVVVVRSDQDVRVLTEACSHLGGPLSDGTVAEGCITCPWHGSTFRMSDGSVVHGPATAPQTVLETLVVNGVVSVRRPDHGSAPHHDTAIPRPRAAETGLPTGRS